MCQFDWLPSFPHTEESLGVGSDGVTREDLYAFHKGGHDAHQPEGDQRRAWPVGCPATALTPEREHRGVWIFCCLLKQV